MFKHILVPIDGSERSLQAGRKALALAKEANSAVTTVMVSPTYRRLSDEGYVAPVVPVARRKWEAGMAARAQAVLDDFSKEASDAGVECTGTHVFNDRPYRAIIDAATGNDCDLVVMGSHGYGGFKQFMLGSETAHVLSHSKIPVLVYR